MTINHQKKAEEPTIQTLYKLNIPQRDRQYSAILPLTGRDVQGLNFQTNLHKDTSKVVSTLN
jgi:hypothetical protein